MFNSDNPITSRSEDKLGRDGFCKHFAKSIMNYNENETLTIGLFGEWGSGKTSIINMTLEYIDAEYVDSPNRKPIIIKYDPWNFSDQNNLIQQFFKELSQNLKRKEYGEKLNMVGEAVENYSIYLEPFTFTLTSIPGISIIFNSIGKSISKYFTKRANDIGSLKTEIKNKILKIDKKIIVIIDDIDRLTNTEIRQIFQLVKSLADFPNVIYILSFDREIVCEALKEVQKGDGNDYIEKIIQVPIEVPKAEQSDIFNLLFNELNKTLSIIPDGSFDNYYWGNIFNYGIKDFFKSIRDVKRFLNIFRFGFHPIMDEVNPVDFLVITSLQVFLPTLYDKIKNNKELFVSESKKFLDPSSIKDLSHEKKDYEDLLKSIPDEKVKGLDMILRRMFPKVELLANEQQFSYSDENMNEWLLKNRICHPEKFDIYFSLSLSKLISETEIIEIIENVSDIKITKIKIEEFIASNRISYFLISIYARIDTSFKERQENILKLILGTADLYLNYQKSFSPIIYKILNNCGSVEQRFQMLRNSISVGDNGLYVNVELISTLESEHSEDSTIPESERLLNLKSIKELEEMLITKIELAATNGSLLNNNKLPFILYRWKRWGVESELNSYLEKIKSDDILLIKFISGFTYPVKVLGSGDVVPNITYDQYFKDLKQFLDVDEVYKKIKDIKQGEIYNTFNEKEKISIEWFERYYEGRVGRGYSF